MCRERAVTREATVPSAAVPASQRIALLVATAALALAPTTALAQNGAGDDQYQDPFAGDPSQTQTTPSGGSTSSGSSSGSSTQSTPQTAPSTTQAPPASPTQTPSAASNGELPRTGSDAWLPALAGLALLAVGLALMRRRGGHADG
jgi:LPXTG-motif cell wall-anchored protein